MVGILVIHRRVHVAGILISTLFGIDPRSDTLAHYGLISAILRLFLPDPPGAPIPKNEFLVTFSDHIASSLLGATEDCRSAR